MTVEDRLIHCKTLVRSALSRVAEASPETVAAALPRPIFRRRNGAALIP